jgi:hypothetical protein
VPHFITVPINENGVVFDVDMNLVVQEAIAFDPFGFTDVYVYSHGWSNDAARALDEYNRFSVDLHKQMIVLGRSVPPPFARPPGDSLGVGIHWPSQITEDPNSPLNDLQLLTFFTMEQRADAVGKNAVYTMLRLMINARHGTPNPLRFFLLGHSFGCKVLLSALQDLQVDVANGTIAVDAGTSFSVVLLEPATDHDNLDPGDIYGNVCQIANLRLLMSTSGLDLALTKWFPLAHGLANLFHKGKKQDALGAVGPTPAAAAAFGGAKNVSVVPGFVATGLRGVQERFVVADLTPVHQFRVTNKLYSGGFSGSHSDINIDEVYQLVMGFLFGLAPPPAP